MIKISKRAAEQIRYSAQQGKMENLSLRIAATRLDDGSLHYGMGFDDATHEQDQRVSSEGIDVVVAPDSLSLLSGATLDFVELEPGKPEFVFLNPNDPNFVPPKEGE
jgi:iron-sulfur cluster assembly protein